MFGTKGKMVTGRSRKLSIEELHQPLLGCPYEGGWDGLNV
jgi:hypothetical protein